MAPDPADQRRQFNIQLPASLIRRIKIAAIDGDQSLARFVQEALEAQLGPDPAIRPRTPEQPLPDEPSRDEPSPDEPSPDQPEPEEHP